VVIDDFDDHGQLYRQRATGNDGIYFSNVRGGLKFTGATQDVKATQGLQGRHCQSVDVREDVTGAPRDAQRRPACQRIWDFKLFLIKMFLSLLLPSL
jgi:hypothetical protein